MKIIVSLIHYSQYLLHSVQTVSLVGFMEAGLIVDYKYISHLSRRSPSTEKRLLMLKWTEDREYSSYFLSVRAKTN